MGERKNSFLAGKYDTQELINSDAPEIGNPSSWGEPTQAQKEAGKKVASQEKLQKLKKEKKEEQSGDTPSEKRLMVIDGATLQCPYAQKEGKLKVTSNELKLQDQLWATQGDGCNMVNLQFPGLCQHPKFGSNKPPCMSVIKLSPWQNVGTTTVQEQKVLVKESYITCDPTPNTATAKPIPKVDKVTTDVRELLVARIEGPFDGNDNLVKNPITGNYYWFKAYTNIIPTFAEERFLKWAKKTNYKIENIPNSITFHTIKKIDTQNNCVVYSQLIEYRAMRLYAYFQKPVDKVSLLCRGKDKFHYKGVKKWGTSQGNIHGDFSTVNSKVTEQELTANLDQLGKENVRILKELSSYDTRFVNLGQSIIELIYEYAAGTRQVLSNDDDIENKVVDNFYKFKYGKKLSFDEKSKQSEKLHKYNYFQQYFKNYLEVIKILLKEKTIQSKDGKDIADLFGKKSYTPNFSIISDIYTYDYYGLMGGTQTIKVDLEITEMDNNTYEVKTKMYIGDWYGSDWGDINGGNLSGFLKEIKFDWKEDWKHPKDLIKRIKEAGKKHLELKGNVPSLNAFFWLQHYYGCHPYETEIIYQDTNYIQL